MGDIQKNFGLNSFFLSDKGSVFLNILDIIGWNPPMTDMVLYSSYYDT